MKKSEPIEEGLARVLRVRAAEASPRPLTASQIRRSRLYQVRTLLVGGLSAAFLVLGSVTGVGYVIRGTEEPGGSAVGDSLLSERLFIVDTDETSDGSKVVAVGPADGDLELLRSYEAGHEPSMVLSPDGSRLYVASIQTDDNLDELWVHETATGNVLVKASLERSGETEVVGRVLSTGFHCCPTTAISPDGNWIFLLEVTEGDELVRDFYIATYDVRANQLLPGNVLLDTCEPGIQQLIPLPGERRIAVQCQATNDVRIYEISATGGLSASGTIPLPTVNDSRTDEQGNDLDLGDVAWSSLSPDQTFLYSITQSGHVAISNLDLQTVVAEADITLPPDRHIVYAKTLLSPDGLTMYLAVGGIDYDSMSADEVLVVDTTDWEQIASIHTDWFYNMTLGADGRFLYATNPDNGNIILVDLERNQQVAVIPGVTFGIVTPQLLAAIPEVA